MATKKKRALKGKSRTAYVPAGFDCIVFNPNTEKVFLIQPGVEWPAELQEKIAIEAKKAYEAGRRSMEQDTATRMYSLQESFVEAITAIRRHSVSDQNKIVATILNEIAASRQNQVAALQRDIEQFENQLVNAVDMQKQFADIQQGKVISL